MPAPQANYLVNDMQNYLVRDARERVKRDLSRRWAATKKDGIKSVIGALVGVLPPSGAMWSAAFGVLWGVGEGQYKQRVRDPKAAAKIKAAGGGQAGFDNADAVSWNSELVSESNAIDTLSRHLVAMSKGVQELETVLPQPIASCHDAMKLGRVVAEVMYHNQRAMQAWAQVDTFARNAKNAVHAMWGVGEKVQTGSLGTVEDPGESIVLGRLGQKTDEALRKIDSWLKKPFKDHLTPCGGPKAQCYKSVADAQAHLDQSPHKRQAIEELVRFMLGGPAAAGIVMFMAGQLDMSSSTRTGRAGDLFRRRKAVHAGGSRFSPVASGGSDQTPAQRVTFVAQKIRLTLSMGGARPQDAVKRKTPTELNIPGVKHFADMLQAFGGSAMTGLVGDVFKEDIGVDRTDTTQKAARSSSRGLY